MAVRRLSFREEIAASPARVWQVMFDPDLYRDWTTAFAEGSHFEGSWERGSRIRFLAPSGDGMVAEIAESRPHEFLSIKHLGFLAGGVEDLESEAVRAWAPAFENYTFRPTPDGTELIIDQDVAEEWADYLAGAWPKALTRLKEIAESP